MVRATVTSFFISIILIFMLPFSASSEITAGASLSSSSFNINRGALLTITVGGGSSADIQLVEVDGLRFTSRGQSTSMNFVNGNYSVNISKSYLVQALKPGTYIIPPITVISGGDSAKTKPITFTVSAIKQNQSPGKMKQGSSKGQNDIAFIRLSEISKHYSGEIVPITIKAYFNAEYRPGLNSEPTLKGDGVVMSPFVGDPEQSQEQINGKIYSVVSWDTTISGIKAGNQPISFELDATVQIPQQRRRGRSAFNGSTLFGDTFFDSFFSSVQRKAIKVSSPEVNFQVAELPSTNQPENFTGAIGQFLLEVGATPTKVEIGEPITLDIVIKGKGNFDRVESPVFPLTDKWKTYSPTSDYSGKSSPLSGEKRFEQAIVAKYADLTQIPALSFSYFDPRENSYKTISSKPIAVNVTEPEASVGTQTLSIASKKPKPSPQPAPAAETKNLAPLHLETGEFYAQIIPLYKKMWFIAATGLCIFLLLLVLLFRLRQRNLKKHPQLQQQKIKRRLLTADLAKLEQAMDNEDSYLFLALSRQTIQQQLGLLWNVEPSAISLADIKDKLANRSALIELFETAERGAYGAVELSPKSAATYLATVQKELEELI